MTVAIELAGPADAAPILTLPDLSPSTHRSLAADLARRDRCAVVARDRERVVGAAIGALLVDEAHLLDVAVASDARRAGLGRRLITELWCRLRGRGAAAMTLEVRPSNEGARVLYRRLGFVEEGRRPRYYPDGEDALLLWRRGAP